VATGISTRLQLIDQMAAPIMAIQNAVNGLQTRFTTLDNAADIDTPALKNMSRQLEDSSLLVQRLQSNIEGIQPKSVPLEIVPNVGSLNDVTNEVLQSQQRINEQALSIDLLPKNAITDINAD
jgi:hypothetical protein